MRKRHVLLGATAVLDAGILIAAAPNYLLVGTIFYFLLLAKSWIFVVLYGFRSNWRATASGRAVMGLIASIALICTLGTLSLALGDYPGRAFVRLVLIAAIALTVMNLLLTLIEEQRKGREEGA